MLDTASRCPEPVAVANGAVLELDVRFVEAAELLGLLELPAGTELVGVLIGGLLGVELEAGATGVCALVGSAG